GQGNAQISQCLTDYCDSNSGCPVLETAQSSIDRKARLCDSDSGKICYEHTNICPTAYAPVLDDIAGVGIYASYWMQNGIALIAFGLLRLFDFWIYYLVLALFYCKQGAQGAQSTANRAREASFRYRVPNLIAALIEFHKAQCFFMIAVQVAATVIARTGGFHAQSLQQLSNSYGAISLVPVCGYLPVVMTLLSLHGAGKNSWYLMGLSIITVVTAGVTAFSTRRFDPSSVDLTYLQDVSGQWTSCGNKNPTTWCLNPQDIQPFDYPGGIKHTFIFCIVVLAFLFLDKCRLFHKMWSKIQTIGNDHAADPKMSKQRTNTWRSTVSHLSAASSFHGASKINGQRRISNLLYGCVWILFLFFYCRIVYLLSRWINGQSGVVGPSSWTFGQIVGITVWVPSLIQYLYLESRELLFPATRHDCF
ncbi:MAG: hypothetical protein Q9174_006624, partial [Haloplaca sp. 1 TL-2023]